MNSRRIYINLIVTLAFSALVLCYAYWAGLCESPSPRDSTITQGPAVIVPSPWDIQRLLNEAEPEDPIEVDGIIGPDTMAKWNRVFCSQSAAATFVKGQIK